MKTSVVAMAILLACAAAQAQYVPKIPLPGVITSRPVATSPGDFSPTTSNSAPPKNLDVVLDNPLTLNAEKTTLGEFLASLQRITQTNVAINWNALKVAGLSRDTSVSLHVAELSYEYVVRTLADVLPDPNGPGGRLNYTVGDNTLTITTNAELGKGPVEQPYVELGPLLNLTLDGEGAPNVNDRVKILEAVYRAELLRGGEPMDAKGHQLSIKNGQLDAIISDRAYSLILRVQGMFANPIKPGMFGPGLIVTANAKHTQDALAKVSPNGKLDADFFLAVAKNPKKFSATANVALLPDTVDELAKEKPSIGGTINDGGVLLVGPAEAFRGRTLFAVYDLRDVIKKTAARQKISGAAAQALVLSAEGKVPLEGGAHWGGAADLGKAPAIMIPYSGLLMVFATADDHRQLTAALAVLNR